MTKRRKKPKRGEKFERIVAAVHAAQHKGAEVTWNEDIDGRQFDVVVRFKFGFYDYLTLIECKDHKKPVEVGEVDAFVTKKTDAHADKAIMVSASGFQTGARDVAKKHGIHLYTLQYIRQIPEELLTQEIVSVLRIYPIGFRKPPSEKLVILVPYDPFADLIHFFHNHKKFARQMSEIILTNYGGMSIGELVKIFSQLLVPYNVPGVPNASVSFCRATDKPQYHQLELSIGTTIIMPDYPDPIPVTHFLFLYWMDKANVIKQVVIDPTVLPDFGSKYDFKNILTNESTLIDPKTLCPAFDTTFRPATFYEQPALQLRYYCEAVNDKSAYLCLIESYNQGTLCQARLTVPLTDSDYYLEISDQDDIDRLRAIYQHSFSQFI